MSVTTFTDQSESCTECDTDVRVDTIFDRETVRYYFQCPECGEANVVE